MTKLPRSISILGQKIKIIRRLPKGHSHEKSGVLGLYDYIAKTIYVDPTQDKEQTYRTLLHEVRHAVQYRSGLAFTGLSADILEMDAETDANATYELLEQLGAWE